MGYPHIVSLDKAIIRFESVAFVPEYVARSYPFMPLESCVPAKGDRRRLLIAVSGNLPDSEIRAMQQILEDEYSVDVDIHTAPHQQVVDNINRYYRTQKGSRTAQQI